MALCERLYVNGWMIEELTEDDGRDYDDPMSERRALGETARD